MASDIIANTFLLRNVGLIFKLIYVIQVFLIMMLHLFTRLPVMFSSARTTIVIVTLNAEGSALAISTELADYV